MSKYFLTLEKLVGTERSSYKSVGLIRMIRSIASSFNFAERMTGATDLPVAIISAGSPTTSLINSVIN